MVCYCLEGTTTIKCLELDSIILMFRCCVEVSKACHLPVRAFAPRLVRWAPSEEEWSRGAAAVQQEWAGHWHYDFSKFKIGMLS